ncbi:MAG TPA: YetF domain-containing protein [Gaiellaceae bacterium]|jgi:uncharacterized membrane protein YcaP (DUF421 family)
MDIVLRGIFVFFALYVLMRVIGRRELSKLEPFDLILLIILGDAVQQGLTQDDYSLTGSMLAIVTIAVLQVAVSFLNYRFPRLRPVLNGEPVVVVQDGKPIDRNLKRERLTLDDIAESARMQGIGSLDEVAWGVLETSGTISFIKKSE